MKLAWSNLAVADLRELRRYSIRRWGSDVAARYLIDVRAAAERIAADPDRTRGLEGPFRLARVRSRYLVVWVSDEDDVLTVARVLHIAMDVERHLPPLAK